MKISFYTLGCKVNQNESAALMNLFCSKGYSSADRDEQADVYVVNSCTVTSTGDKKSRQWLRRAKRENPNSITVLMGCYPQAYNKQAALISEADIILGANNKKELYNYVVQYQKTKQKIIAINPHEKKQLFEELPQPIKANRTRAFVKIEDGCNKYCSYCIIPYARGNVRSRNEQSILSEIKSLAESGVCEVVITGINICAYGTDTGTNIADIVEKIALIDGIQNIRLGSLEPDMLTNDILDRILKVQKLCPQFHLALQSGCDKTLKAMNRRYSTSEYESVVNYIKNKLPCATFITDVIVGFPGESDEDFEQSLNFVQKINFLKVHVFNFSRREGTKAFNLPNQIDAQLRAQRSEIMQKASDDIRNKIIRMFEGSVAKVLLEKDMGDGYFTGYTREYIPVIVKAANCQSGDIVSVTLKDFDTNKCNAEVLF